MWVKDESMKMKVDNTLLWGKLLQYLASRQVVTDVISVLPNLGEEVSCRLLVGRLLHI